MSDPSRPLTPIESKPAPSKSSQTWFDLGPLLIFVGSYHYLRRSDPDGAMLKAAGIFMIAAVFVYAYVWLRHKRVSKMLLFTTVIIVITAGLAILSGNPVIFYMKPTIINILFGVAVIGGLFVDKNVIKMMMGEAFSLPERAWKTLAVRWGLWFFCLAGVNEYVWRNFDESVWVNFKLFGLLPLTLIFSLLQMPYILKHGKLHDGETKMSSGKSED